MKNIVMLSLFVILVLALTKVDATYTINQYVSEIPTSIDNIDLEKCIKANYSLEWNDSKWAPEVGKWTYFIDAHTLLYDTYQTFQTDGVTEYVEYHIFIFYFPDVPVQVGFDSNNARLTSLYPMKLLFNHLFVDA